MAQSYLAVMNPNGVSHRVFLTTWALPRFQAKRGAPCTLILAHAEDLAAIGSIDGVAVKAAPVVARRTFYLGRLEE